MMTYEEALAFIHSVAWQGSRPGLSRITELLARLGNPERGLRAVHVAGTNGKGSFCAMTESILRCAGYKTGLFTSPYIEHFEERIQCGGVCISKDDLAAVTTDVAAAAREMRDPPTEFELLTAIGFLYFQKQRVDVAVIECGMGGRLDSTNALEDPLLSVITGVSLDHTAILGDTVEQIAYEKAGIVKPGCPVFYGGADPRAEAVIAAAADKCRSRLVKREQTPRRQRFTLDGTTFDCPPYTDLFLPLLGSYQPDNAANVLACVALLRERGLAISDEAVREGLASVRWKGRFEKLADRPPVFFDGGHNPEGVAAATETVRLYFGDQKIVVLTGVMQDKDYETIAAALATVADTVFTVTPDNPRAMPAEKYAAVLAAKGVSATPCDGFEEAVSRALAVALPRFLPILCVGSLYAYADFKRAVEHQTIVLP